MGGEHELQAVPDRDPVAAPAAVEQVVVAVLGVVGRAVDRRHDVVDLLLVRLHHEGVVHPLVGRVHRELARVDQGAADLAERRLRGLHHRDGLLRVADRLPHADALGPQALGDLQVRRVVRPPAELETRAEALQVARRRAGRVRQVAMRVERHRVGVDSQGHTSSFQVGMLRPPHSAAVIGAGPSLRPPGASPAPAGRAPPAQPQKAAMPSETGVRHQAPSVRVFLRKNIVS